MLISLIVAMQAAAAEPAPAPSRAEMRYLRVSGVEAGAMKLFAARAEESAAARRVRPAAMEPPPFERCAGTQASPYGVDTECIRALVPEARAGAAPVVALAVVENRRSNITGRVVLKSHTIYCIGPRAVGFETLNDPLDGRGAELGLQAKVDECIADAFSAARLENMVRDDDGTPRWHYVFTPDRLAENERTARGSSDGIATVRVERIEAGPAGACRVIGTMLDVETGPAIRRGDRIEVALPASCAAAHPMTAAFDLRPGSLVRFYAAWGGGVRYLEPVPAE